MAALATVAKKVWSARRLLVLLFAPLALLPVVFALPPKEGRCLFVILLMAVYWCTEALPLSVTALLPIILFPFLGILPSNKVCPQYFLDTNFLFLSGLIMASAIEEWNLHRRIALKVLMLVGVQPTRLILGMMVTTSFLSMWLSNTASTAMMLPIASAVLKSLFGQETRKDLGQQSEENAAAVRRNGLHAVPTEVQFLAGTEDKDCPEAEAPLDLLADCKKEGEYRRNIWKGFLISIPYSASIGGTATLTGTAPNLILLGQLKSFFPQCDVVNFGSWFIFAFPLMLLFLLAGWLWISFLYGGMTLRGWRRKKKSEIKTDAEDRARAVIREEFQNLGPINFSEAGPGPITASGHLPKAFPTLWSAQSPPSPWRLPVCATGLPSRLCSPSSACSPSSSSPGIRSSSLAGPASSPLGFFPMLSLEWPLSPSCSSSRPKGPLSSGGLTLKVRGQGWGLSGLSDDCGLKHGHQWPGGRARAWDPSPVALTCFFPSLCLSHYLVWGTSGRHR
ncbi:solute carrier family 13 member 3 isoform X3 [Panthera leo]|uniref:solute carrier family 13 member 3 isoform X3 n=1 Tax=Panthera leo TaxID=9689 RepID=UPI001C69CEE2|nr:solute carrier family 13 member 3 isoform X3 [Panthera leo]